MGMIADECRGKSNDFIDGYIAGLWAFAWWKDGVQYCGTCGTTLKEARAEAEGMRSRDLGLLSSPATTELRSIFEQTFGIGRK